VKTKVLLAIMMIGLISTAFGQKQTLDLTFTAVDNASYVQLDSIKVMNRTQGSDATLYWPDTTLTLEITPGDLLLYIGYSSKFPYGIADLDSCMDNFTLFQNYPNPVKDQGVISMYIPEKGTVNIMVTDVRGRVVNSSSWQLEMGDHSFRLTPGSGNLFFLTALWNSERRSIKILSTGANEGKRCILEYTGNSNRETVIITSKNTSDQIKPESGILDKPVANETYTFQFATNIPCKGTPTVTYEGQVYNTIQIFSQCWLKENLNVGTMINIFQDQSNNDIIEKYCYTNNSDSCAKYGGLYQWDEMMKYTMQEGVQSICPSGWHLPTDEEWKVLEGAADSRHGIGDKEWDISIFQRGYDDGTNLKNTSGWFNDGSATDLLGFSGLSGGHCDYSHGMEGVGSFGYWWTSTGFDYLSAMGRSVFDLSPMVERADYIRGEGFSVRCLRDY
jgi:uncharacterized protein (TIGR02145 family)